MTLEKKRGAGMQVVGIEYGLPPVTEPLRSELERAEAFRMGGGFWVERNRFRTDGERRSEKCYTLMADGVYISVLRWDAPKGWRVCKGGSMVGPPHRYWASAMLTAIPIAHRELSFRAARTMAKAVVAQDALRKVVVT